MSKLIVRGPVLTLSGYGYHSRQFVHWARDLQAAGHFEQVEFEIMPWGITPWMLHSDDPYDAGIISYVMSNSTQGARGGKASIQIQLPHEWDPGIASFNIGVTAGVETDRVSRQWVDACFRMDRVIVPSEFSKQAFLNSVTDDYDRKRLNKRIEVINEAYHPSLLASDDADLDLSGLPEKNFLLFGQLTGTDASNDRKNTFNSIKWFIEEWCDEPDVGLIVKTNSGKNTTIDRKITRGKLDACVKEAAKISGRGEHPKVFLMHGAMTESEKRALYTDPKVAALLMPSRGEGYGLPVLEASLLGLPVIAPPHSGYMDFAADLRYPIGFRPVQVPPSKIDGTVFVEGALWVDASEADCKAAMRESLSDDSGSRETNERIAEELSIESIVARMNARYARKGELL